MKERMYAHSLAPYAGSRGWAPLRGSLPGTGALADLPRHSDLLTLSQGYSCLPALLQVSGAALGEPCGPAPNFRTKQGH